MAPRSRPLTRWVPAAGVVAAAVVVGALVAAVLLALGRGEPSSRAGAAEASRGIAPVVSEPEPQPVVTFIGDSWTEGHGGTGWRGYAVLTGERLGWVTHVLGVGGSGYVVPGSGSPYGARIHQALATDPDVLVIQGSLNEHSTNLAVLEPAVAATLTRLRDESDPRTRILVLGASYVPGLPRDVIDGINGVLGRTAAELGLAFVDPATENWSDPADPALWSDAVHPGDLGHQRVADRLAPVLEELLAADAVGSTRAPGS